MTHIMCEDGFGSAWSCSNDERRTRPCGLQVVRPGKVQCWCDDETEDGSCLHSSIQSSGEDGTHCTSICRRELCSGCWGRGEGIFTDDPSGWGKCSDCGGSGFPARRADIWHQGCWEQDGEESIWRCNPDCEACDAESRAVKTRSTASE